MTDAEIMVRVQHIREAHLCTNGARAWFRKYDISWQELLDSGVSVERIVATGDALGLRVADIARKDAQNG
jgi:hypothetical protein